LRNNSFILHLQKLSALINLSRIRYPERVHCWKYKTTAIAVLFFIFILHLQKLIAFFSAGLDILKEFTAGNTKPLLPQF